MGGSNFMFALYTIVYAALLGQQLLKSAFHSRVYHAICSENCVLSKEDQQSVNEAEEQSVVAAQTQHTHTHLHSGGCLLPQLGQVLVALLNLLIQALVLNLELLKVDEVEPLRQLLLPASPGVRSTREGGPTGGGSRKG